MRSVLKIILAASLLFAVTTVAAEQKDDEGAIVVAVLPPETDRKLKATSEFIASSILDQLQQNDVNLVEREKISALLSELEIGNSKAGRESTLKAGQMAGATRVILGDLRRDTDKQLTWLVKILDSETGVLLDLRVIHFLEKDIEKTVDLFAKEIAESVAKKTPFAGKYLGIGTFENISPGGRYATLSDDLKAYLEKALTSDEVRIVERGFLEALLDEAELYRGGMTDGKTRAMPIPACCLVTGLLQAHNDGEDRVMLNLRIANIGSNTVVKSIEKKAGEELYSAVADAISESLKNTKMGAEIDAKLEAAEHHKRGLYLTNLRFTKVPYPGTRGNIGRPSGSGSWKVRSLNIYGAIQEFRAALLLDPTLVETRFFLGICLKNLRKNKRAAKRLNEVVAMAPESKMAFMSRERLITLEATDPRDRLRRTLAFRTLVKDKLHLAEIDVYLARFVAAKSKTFSIEEATKYNAAAAVSLIELAKETKQISVYSFRNRLPGIHSRMKPDKEEWLKQCRIIKETVRNHDPTFAPYFEAAILAEHLDRIPDWKERIDTMLTECDRDPKSVFRVEVLARDGLRRLMHAVSAKNDHERVIRIGEFSLKHGGDRKNWWAANHEMTCTSLVDAYFKLEQWEKAMPLCKLYSPLETQEYCRKQMGKEVSERPKPLRVKSSSRVKLPKLHREGQSILFIQKDAVYLSTKLGIHSVALPSMENRLLIAAKKVTAEVKCAQRAGNVIWLGTENGIYACNVTTGDVRHYTVKDDGLPYSEVTCLTVTEDRVWFGFRQNQLGGVGYIDRNGGTFVSLYPGLKKGVTESKSFYLRPQTPLDEAPSVHVTGIAHCNEDAIYVAVFRKGVQRYDLKTGKWSTIFTNRYVRSLTAVPGYIGFATDTVGYSTDSVRAENQGLYVYDTKEKKLVAVDEEKHGYTNQGTNRMVGSQGHFFVTTSRGVFVIDAKTRRCRLQYEDVSYSAEFSDLGDMVAWWTFYNSTQYSTLAVESEKE